MSDKKMSTKNKIIYKAVIIGAGKIAAGFDNPNDRRILTHSHAYKVHSGVSLEGIFDIDIVKANAAAKKWNIKSFANLEEMLTFIKPDIVSVCTPDGNHYKSLLKVLAYNPKLVICEKPITLNSEDAKRVVRLYKKRNIALVVNFSRRYDLFVRQIQNKLQHGYYGKVISAQAIYSKGIMHNGSHMLDLARFLFGEILSGNRLCETTDYDKVDKTIGGFLKFKNCPQFHLICADERRYSVFELMIICERGRVTLNNFGFNFVEEKIVSDPIFSGYKILGKMKNYKTKLDEAMLIMVTNAVDFLDGKSKIWCTADDALKIQIISENLIKNKKYVR